MKKKEKIQGELVYGTHSVLELLKAKRRKIISIYTVKPVLKIWPTIEKLLPKYPVNIQYVGRDVLTRIAGSADHQGILAWADSYPFRKQFFSPEKSPFLLMLDGVQDIRNLGAILRSAYCTGVDGIILIKKQSAPLNAAAHKASAGFAEHIQIYEAPSIEAATQDLSQAGYNLYLATFEGENAIDCAFKGPLCIVMGSEGTGISKSLYRSGTHVTIPQKTADISYNVSVAAGILLVMAATKNKKI